MSLKELAVYAPMVSAAAIVASSITAFAVFAYTRRTNKRRATLDMVMKTFLDNDANSRYDDFISLVNKDADVLDTFQLTSLLHSTPTNIADRNVVLAQLNTYELVALGIRRGVFDEKFYKHWFHRQFTKDYDSVKPLLSLIQHEAPSVFCEYGSLYERWMKSKHPVSSPSRWKLMWWGATKNHEKLKVHVKP